MMPMMVFRFWILRIKFLAGLFLMFFCYRAAMAVNLTELWDAAERNSAEYAAARYGFDATVEQEIQAKAALGPQITASSNWQRQPESLSNSRQTIGWQVRLNQAIFDASKGAQYRQSQHNSEVAQYRLMREQESLLLKVSETYFNYLLATDTIDSAQEEKRAYEQQLKRAKLLFKQGAATALDINEAQAGYDQAYAKEAAAITQQHIYANQLSSDTGVVITDVEQIATENLIQSYLPIIRRYDLAQWQNLALQNNYEYREQKAQVESSYENLNAVKSSRLPVVSGSVAYQNNRYVYHNDVRQTGKGLNVGININIPLYTSGEQSSRVRESSAKYYEAESKLLASERKIKLAVQQAYMQTMTAIQQINAQKRVLISSQQKLNATQIGQKFGLRHQLEVLQAQQEVGEAKRQLAQVNYQFLNSYLSLMKESGLGLRKMWHLPK